MLGCFVHCLVCSFCDYMLLILARKLYDFGLFVGFSVGRMKIGEFLSDSM